MNTMELNMICPQHYNIKTNMTLCNVLFFINMKTKATVRLNAALHQSVKAE